MGAKNKSEQNGDLYGEVDVYYVNGVPWVVHASGTFDHLKELIKIDLAVNTANTKPLDPDILQDETLDLGNKGG
jgi:hypothetical protein